MQSIKSQGIISEFIQVMASQIERKQLQDLLSATFYSIMIDETTDVSILNEMIAYARLCPQCKKVTPCTMPQTPPVKKKQVAIYEIRIFLL